MPRFPTSERERRVPIALWLVCVLGVAALQSCGSGGYTGEAKIRWDSYQERSSRILELRRSESYAEAADLYADLWREAAQPAPPLGSPSTLSLKGSMRSFADEWPRAREEWATLWEPTASRVLDGSATQNEVHAWVDLIRIMEQYDSLVVFLESAREDPVQLGVVRSLGSRRTDIYYSAKRAGRWDLAGLVYEDPLGDIRAGERADLMVLNPPAILVIGTLGKALAPRAGDESVLAAAFDFGAYAEAIRKSDRWRAEAAADRYAACLAAGREREAERLLRFARGKVGSTLARALCVQRVLEAGVVRAEHAEWFDHDAELAAIAPDLHEQVLEALSREP